MEGVKFKMGGWWVMDFDITSGGRTERVRFHLQLKKQGAAMTRIEQWRRTSSFARFQARRLQATAADPHRADGVVRLDRLQRRPAE